MIVPSSQMKMDIMFYNAHIKLKSKFLRTLVWHSLKLLLLVIFIILDQTLQTQLPNQDIITVFLGVAIGIVFLNLLVQTIFYCTQIKNQQKVLLLAIQANHAVNQPQTQGIVSQRMYNVQNQTQITSEGLTEQIKQRYQSVTQNLIQQAIQNRSPRYNCIHMLVQMLSFGLIIFGIVALSIGSPNTAQLVIIIIFLVAQALSHILVFVVLLILALSPLICIVLCIISCCCNSGAGQASAPQPVPATMSMINQAGGDCSICYQSFKVSDPVVVLRCSPKHMFHPVCINGWLRLTSNCPICRKGLSGQQNQ